MSEHNGYTRPLLVGLLVFVGGTGVGFAWRQGWLPIELLPARTGVLDEQDAVQAPSESLPLPTSAPLASLENRLPDAVVATPPAALPEQSEPEPAGSETAAVTIPATVPPTPAVQPTGYQEPEPAPASPPKPATTADFDVTLGQADAHIAAGETLAAHKLLSKLYWTQRARRPEIQERIDRTARIIFFDAQPHFIEPYVIQSGDRLESIAAGFHLAWEYLSALNRTDPRRIQAGRRLKVVRGPFAAVVELDDFALTVHLQGYYVRRYAVGVGKDGSSPIGKFPVLNKVVNPSYTDPDGRVIDGDDPANPLGERWIDLGNSYGLHGTIEPDSIGQAASRGCIRLRDDDIVAVYNFLVTGSEVVIRK